jgi:hypothetical protein
MGGRGLVRGLAALAAGAVPFALGAEAAGAVESHFNASSFEHTFTTWDGRQVTCFVGGSSSLFRESSGTPFTADAQTFSFGASQSDPACGDGLVSVSTSYLDSAGRRTLNASTGGGGIIFWVADNVAGDLSVTHTIVYFNCQANCEVTFTTQPK